MFDWWLLNEDGHCGESLSDLSYPAVLLKSGEGGSDCFIEAFGGDLD